MTIYQLAARVQYTYGRSGGYDDITPAGLISCYGWELYHARRNGAVILGRLYRSGREATWSHGCGINSTCPPDGIADWVELEYAGGDPTDAQNWHPTGRAWLIGAPISDIPRRSEPTAARPTRAVAGLSGGDPEALVQ